ncbi:MAG: hypothetical protein PHI90_11135 [Clostridia bacterium]|nr:hypothetical protein [Clostridia bacterium]
MLNSYKIFALTLILIVGVFIQQGYCANRYYWLTSTDTITYSLDTQSIYVHKDNNSIDFDVWVKFQYNEDGIQEVISYRNKNGLPTAGYENLKFSLRHEIFSINPSGRMIYKDIQYLHYDTNGKVLGSYTYPTSNSFIDIVPNSLGEAIFDKIGNYCSANRKIPK